ncbi:MAG: aminoglycoside phosphotransferase family protein [Candidatus Devosia phytovorans]|uniref:Aminoglycoside phosphotransferase family protein n=1 Tax=Candidatus Devosia phytovorans TaxID=3121372 RepID=A0AAJ5VV82_9HYPH|nr:aminoglycoside phosphotransferase family protein [Devosia sp.]WEK04977.1 MAG: aminoglycoside phosphotransferase family protein [Devosia sp.]
MSEGGRFAVPESVRRRAIAEGAAGQDWLARLDTTIEALEANWGVTIGEALEGGSAAFVAEAIAANGDAFIVKVGTPGSAIGRHEADVLQRADGHGYVKLLRHDPGRQAMLLEKLGERLDLVDISHQQKIDIVCATLNDAWMPVPLDATYVTGTEKANSLATGILQMWERNGQPCSAEVIESAMRYCQERAALYKPEGAVLAHGDPHMGNLLADPATDPIRFKLVDPDGLAIEPAYDLGVLLRGWNEGIEGKNAHNIGRGRVRLLTQRTQVPAEAIWQWAYIERVSTGLLLLEIGDHNEGRLYLRTAEALLVI